MKRALLSIAILLCTTTTQAQRLDPQAPLKNFAARVLPRCPGGTLTLEVIPGGPAGFDTYGATVRSSDKYCGGLKYVLHSPKSQQVLIGSIIQVPAGPQPVATRIASEAGRLLNAAMTATVAPFPLPDGLKAVTMTRQTPYGPFGYNAFLDQSGKFLVVGFRSTLTSDPAKLFREQLGADTASRRGTKTAKVEIIEVSDFQCPTCARAHTKLEPLFRQNLAKMNYIRIDLPLFENHDWAVQAAMGGRAIQKAAPNKYWDYVDWVFKNQESIEKRKDFDAVLREYADDNDIAWASLQKTYTSATERQALLEQVSRAFTLGIASTPTFIVNGQILGYGPEGTFTTDAIKSALGVK